jgi:hypothetical protein
MIAILVVATLTGLGLLHLYWAFGGLHNTDRVIPSRAKVDPSSGVSRQAPAFTPSPRDTLLVAAALIAAAVLVALRAGLFAEAVSHWAVEVAVIGIAVVFLARAVGDLKLVGLFKPNNGTAFAYWDTWIYSPLCIVLAGATGLVAWY